MDMKDENIRQLENMRKNFIYLRESRGWSIRELSAASGISEDILLDVESGNDFSAEYLFNLCMFYGVKPKDIFLEGSI